MQASEELRDQGTQATASIEDEVCAYLIESGRLKKSDLKRAEAFRE